ncbi:MAG TPA: tripartite tricarboxylate transporter TctB family protein [Candidatus Binatia bacterium]|jgi:hypothetical protein
MKANLAFFFLMVFLVAVWAGWGWPYIAKLMPIYVAAIPGLILVVIQLYRDATDWEGRQSGKGGGIEMDEVYDVKLDKAIEIRRTVTFFAWFIAGALGIWLFGIVISLPVLVFLYALVEGKERWITSLVIGACTFAIVWGVFEYMLDSRWPPGVLFR